MFDFSSFLAKNTDPDQISTSAKSTIVARRRSRSISNHHKKQSPVMGGACSSTFNDDSFIRFNISGRSYVVLTQNFCNRTNQTESRTFLENFARVDKKEKLELCDYFLSQSQEFYFDRDVAIFECLLHYYRTNALHCPVETCPQRFLEELETWQVSPSKVASCCKEKIAALMLRHEMKSPNGLNKNNFASFEFEDEEEDDFDHVCLKKYRKTAWNFMENPDSSCAAKIYSIFSVLFVLLSVVTLMVASMPELQEKNYSTGEKDPIQVLKIIEAVCIFGFTIEYIIRFVISPKKWNFVRAPLNIIDLLSVVPYHFEFFMEYAGVYHSNLGKVKGALLMMRILRVLRVLRIFKLARYSGGLSSLGSTLKSSYREIGLLLMFMSITIVLYSTMVYFMERDIENTPFVSIPATFWWCIVTMTTVGYGDMVPVTLGGKLVATITSVSGVIVLAFPITLIVENFNRQYRRELGREGGRRSSIGVPVVRTGLF